MSVSGFPAHAGMDPPVKTVPRKCSGLPRTRGDGPRGCIRPSRGLAASPHTRGWTRVRVRRAAHGGGFPAHAGMDPWQCLPRQIPGWLPRTRGDGPVSAVSSHPGRGASPHTRGWTLPGPRSAHRGAGFPAHAGMDPCRRRSSGPTSGLPRTRGDGPQASEGRGNDRKASPHTRGWTQPSWAGRFVRPWLPRTRGDGPGPQIGSVPYRAASPHTRGWTLPRSLPAAE